MATSYFGDYRSSASEQLESTRQIADLSDHAQALEANIDISDLLTDEQERKIVQYVKSSRNILGPTRSTYLKTMTPWRTLYPISIMPLDVRWQRASIPSSATRGFCLGVLSRTR